MVNTSYFLDDLEERDGDSPGEIGRKASHVTKACNACKRRKAKCDRQRPSCGPCQLRREKCEFTEGDRRHHPDRQFVDSLEQRNNSLEERNKELQARVDALVGYIKKLGVECPNAPNQAPAVDADESKSSSPNGKASSGSDGARSPEMDLKVPSISPALSISPRVTPPGDTGGEALLQDSQPKLIRDERGNHTMYGATSALQHLPNSLGSDSLTSHSDSHSPPSPRTKSNSPAYAQLPEVPSAGPSLLLNYDHLRHLPFHLRMSIDEHEEMLHVLFRVLPAHMKCHATAFLRSMRQTLAYPPTQSFPVNLGIDPTLAYSPSVAPHYNFAFCPNSGIAEAMFPPDAPLICPQLQSVFPSEPMLPPQITPHYSPTLHNATLSLALAYSTTSELRELEQRREVAQMAKANLETELSLPSLTGVKALGFLASFHSGMADHALGWQYFGMCVRMAQALGLNLDSTALVESGDISEALQRERNLTFWSVYIHDKYWSLWFGRTVALPEGSYDIPIPEPNAAVDLLPMNAGDGADDTTELGCQPAFLSSTFVQTCKLMLIASKILSSIYGTKKSVDMNIVSRLRLELDEWHNKLPPALHYSTTTLSASIPHILSLQMTFNWLIILLDRPFYRSVTQPLHHESAVKRCDAALRRIVRLFRSWHDSHGLRTCTTEHSAIIFTAGATFLLSAVQFKPLSEKRRKEGLDGVRFCARLLREMGNVWPAAKEKATILFRLQKKFSTTVDATDGGMSMDISRGDSHTPDNLTDESDWADLQLDLGDDDIIPQFVIDTSAFQQSRTYSDASYLSTLQTPCPLNPVDDGGSSAERYHPTLGPDYFLKTLYQFMENYDTAPQQPQYQAPRFEDPQAEGQAHVIGVNGVHGISDVNGMAGMNGVHETSDEVDDSPLLDGWSSDYFGNLDVLNGQPDNDFTFDA